MIKKLLAIIVLVMVASLSIAGCTSPTSSNQAAGNASQAASTTANTTTSASATPSPSIVPTPTPTPAPSTTPTPTPVPQVPTVISWQVIPVGSPLGTTSGVSFGIYAQGKQICLNGPTASVSVEGGPSGMAAAFPAVSGCDVSMVFNFPTAGMSLGQHAVTASFAGNAQYEPSTATAYIHVMVPTTAKAS